MIKSFMARYFVASSQPLVPITPIVPQGRARSTALLVVIAIMGFLASLALGGVDLIAGAAQDWQSQIAREATIQISPVAGVDIEQSLQQARDLVVSFQGIEEASILDVEATHKLLEPWLGSAFEIENFDLPRLIAVRFSGEAMPDLDLIRATLEQEIAGAIFDDHHLWLGRLASMARTLVMASLVIFVLLLTAMIFTVVFATRATLLEHADIIEVLHFIGADPRFVARQFDRHFLKMGIKGGLVGVGMALLAFWLIRMNVASPMAMAEGSQLALFFGVFPLKSTILLAWGLLLVFIAAVTMFTSRSTVIRQLHEIDRRQSGF